MLDIAREKGIYQSLQKADLLQELPLEQETFDCAVSSAVSTYLGMSQIFRQSAAYPFFGSAVRLSPKSVPYFSQTKTLLYMI